MQQDFTASQTFGHVFSGRNTQRNTYYYQKNYNFGVTIGFVAVFRARW